MLGVYKPRVDKVAPAGKSIAEAKDKLILHVEDDESMLDFIRFLVSKEGFRTSEIGDGLAAMKRVKEQNPDLIILDLMLPGIGGHEFLKKLQAEGFGKIPVVILTSRSMGSETVESTKLEPNVVACFAKPPSSNAFRLLLHDLLNTRPPINSDPPS